MSRSPHRSSLRRPGRLPHLFLPRFFTSLQEREGLPVSGASVGAFPSETVPKGSAVVGGEEARRQAPVHTWYFVFQYFTYREERTKDSGETFLNRFSYVLL